MSLPYVSFRGVSTASLNCYIVEMPSHKKAKMRNTQYAIPGRDGILHVNEGFDTIDIDLVLMLSGVTAYNRQVINAWADGTGKLFTSDDPTRCYSASVINEIIWGRDKVGGVFYDTARITFTCQPFMHETVESTQTITETSNILNPGNVESLPLIQVNGSGTCKFTVGGEEITLENVASGTPVFIDSDAAYVYTNSGMTTMVGHFPRIPLGTSQVIVGSGVTSLVITPRWGWV